jgi:hypothetical protein
MNSDLQLLVFHDSLDVLGGGEKVVATVAKAFNARIAAANVDPEVLQPPPRVIERQYKRDSKELFKGEKRGMQKWSISISADAKPSIMYD